METIQKLHRDHASCINSQRPLFSPGQAGRTYSPFFILHSWQALLGEKRLPGTLFTYPRSLHLRSSLLRDSLLHICSNGLSPDHLLYNSNTLPTLLLSVPFTRLHYFSQYFPTCPVFVSQSYKTVKLHDSRNIILLVAIFLVP